MNCIFFNQDTSKSMHVSSQKTDNNKENVDNDKENIVESMCGIDWGKSFQFLPTFTIKEIEKHRDMPVVSKKINLL